jgi:transcriptional regulator with XRE-family HTH domain
MMLKKVRAADRKTLVSLGRRIHQARVARGLRGSDLGRLARLSQAQISRIETGKQSVRSTVLFRIAKAMKVSPVVFLLDDTVTAELLKALPAKAIPGLNLYASRRRKR